MARRYQVPHCVAINNETDQVCGHEMRPQREAEENHRKTAWVFQCGYCGALRGVDVNMLGRYFAEA